MQQCNLYHYVSQGKLHECIRIYCTITIQSGSAKITQASMVHSISDVIIKYD